jgi:hypothetical protein
VPAGTYKFVLDCIVTSAVDVKFELMARHGTDNLVLSTWSQHFDPLSTGYDAQPYEIGKKTEAIQFAEGDQLVFRYTASAASKADAWIPNGDGILSHGRIPNITLP